MTELLFGLTVIFVGYVIYEVFKTVSETYGGSPPAANSAPSRIENAPGAPAATRADKPASSAPTTTTAPTDQPAPSVPASQPAAAAASESGEEAERGLQLRNPTTGEIAPVPTNYRFAKKWVKDALVAEGLLDRVYKPNELDDAASRKVKDALEKFRRLEKYQA
jgi:hypothetical protein